MIPVDLLFSRRGAELLDGGLGHFSQLQFFGDLLYLRFRVKKAVSKSIKITNHDAWQYSSSPVASLLGNGGVRSAVVGGGLCCDPKIEF